MARATSTAFCRNSTVFPVSPCQALVATSLSQTALTALAIPYYMVQGTNEVGENSVDVVQTGKDRYYIGARVGVPFGQDSGEKDAQCLFASAISANDSDFSHTS